MFGFLPHQKELKAIFASRWLFSVYPQQFAVRLCQCRVWSSHKPDERSETWNVALGPCRMCTNSNFSGLILLPLQQCDLRCSPASTGISTTQEASDCEELLRQLGLRRKHEATMDTWTWVSAVVIDLFKNYNFTWNPSKWNFYFATWNLDCHSSMNRISIL